MTAALQTQPVPTTRPLFKLGYRDLLALVGDEAGLAELDATYRDLAFEATKRKPARCKKILNAMGEVFAIEPETIIAVDEKRGGESNVVHVQNPPPSGKPVTPQLPRAAYETEPEGAN